MNFIEDVVEAFPAARPALIEVSAEGERRVHHFGELFARSAGLSGAFAAQGVERGDVVMTLTGSRVEWVLALLACWRMGAVALPCNPQLRRKDLAVRVLAANPKLAVGEGRYLGELPDGVLYMDLDDVARVIDEDRAQETPADIEDLAPDDPAAIVFTSGTTGEARGVLYPQRYLAGQGPQAEHWFGAREGEIAWCTAAPGWSKSTRNAFIAPWLRGAVAVLHDGRFDPEERLRLIEQLGVNVLCQAPTEYRMLASRAEPRPIPSLRRLVSAGEPIEPETIRLFRERLGLAVGDGYGQTETGQVTGMRPGEDDPARDGSMGRPLPGVEVRVAAGGGDAGGVGELQLRAASSPTFFLRYLDGEPFAEEWWPTGDRVREDTDGYLWFEGRGDDLILSSGYRIGPFEVESALLTHPAVAEAAAVAAPDPERGAVVRAVVVLRDDARPSDALADELRQHVRAQTAPYKYPRIVEFADSLPKTDSGKVRRAALRAAG
ncbi:MAG TPA: AMP-binding protein [Solirubrobacterales bacterium]|nr:AMP-binding protein [Solirubrobacterales bacterium]